MEQIKQRIVLCGILGHSSSSAVVGPCLLAGSCGRLEMRCCRMYLSCSIGFKSVNRLRQSVCWIVPSGRYLTQPMLSEAGIIVHQSEVGSYSTSERSNDRMTILCLYSIFMRPTIKRIQLGTSINTHPPYCSQMIPHYDKMNKKVHKCH